MFEYALFLVFPAAMAFAAAMDFFTLTIPNRVSIVLIAAFVIALPFSGLGAAAVMGHVAAGLLMLAIGVGLFATGVVGGGDAKLLAAASLWLGMQQLLGYLFLVTLAGGLLALLVMVYRSFWPPIWLLGQDWAMRLHRKDGGIPYGVALTAAALWIYPKTPWTAALAI